MIGRRLRVGAATLWLLFAACSSEDDASGPGGGPDAPVFLWQIPNVGLPIERPLEPDRPDPTTPSFDAGAPPSGPVVGEDAGPKMAPDPTLDQLDPDEVYILGTLSQGACYLDAIAPVLAPDEALVGFECGTVFAYPVVRPGDGRMIYSAGGAVDAIYAFRCDGCTYVSSAADYPSDPLANDEPIPTPSCAADAFSGGFAVTADGAVAYRCDDGLWYGEGDEPFATPMDVSFRPLSFGHEATALLADGVVDLESGDYAPFTGLTQPNVIAQRAVEDGYRIAVQPTDIDQPPELWHVAFDGTATSLGAFPAPPADQEVRAESALDGEGRLVQFAQDTTETFRDTIIRRSMDGESAVIYDEADDPVVKLHISSLFTGP